MHLRLLLLPIVVVAACASSGPATERAEQARDAAVDAGLDGDVADFLALAARGDTATYQVRYETGDGAALTVANRPPDRRVEISVDDRTTELQLVLDGEAHTCTPTGDSWRCERTDAFVVPVGPFTGAAVDELRDALAGRADDFTFDVEVVPMAGVEARCLITRLRIGRDRPDLGQAGTMCVSPDGVLLLLDQSGERLEAAEYTTTVSDDLFALPDG